MQMMAICANMFRNILLESRPIEVHFAQPRNSAACLRTHELNNLAAMCQSQMQKSDWRRLMGDGVCMPVTVPGKGLSAVGSVQPEHAVDGAQLGRLDQARVGDDDRVERPVELLLPEGKKSLEHRKLGAEIVVLPHVGLQQPAVVRPAIKNPRRGQAIAGKLALEVLGDHGVPRLPDSESSRSDADSQA